MLNINQELQQGRYRVLQQLNPGKKIFFCEAYDKVLAKNVLLRDCSENFMMPGGEITDHIFDEEAKFLFEIKHEGYLQILDHFTENEHYYFVSESVQGNNVGEIIEKSSKLISPANVLDWGKQILDALDYLHKKTPTVLYFNLKPSNLYVTSDGKIKLLAAGIGGRSGLNGKIKRQAFERANLDYSPLEIIWEKLDQASQRVILNGFDEQTGQDLTKSPDARSDIYSLGATLYHLLTGRFAVNALERSIEILEKNPDPLSAPNEINSNIAGELSDALMKALEIKRENRFESATAMREELEKVFLLLRERKIRELSVKTSVSSGGEFVKSKPKLTKNENLQYESPQKKSGEDEQLEVIKQKLREAETQRLQAEQRAAEAERRLSEIERQKTSEKRNFRDDDVLQLPDLQQFAIETPVVSETVENETIEEILDAEIIEEENEEPIFEQAEIVEELTIQEKKNHSPYKTDSDDFETLFVQPQNNKFFKRTAVAAAGIFILGGALFGIFNFLPTAAEMPNTETINHPAAAAAVEPTDIQPQPSETATPETEPEVAAETNEQQSSENLQETKQSFVPQTEKNAAIKQKTPVPQIASVKQTERKSPENVETKKKVTVDDLINDAPTKKKKVTVDDLINDN